MSELEIYCECNDPNCHRQYGEEFWDEFSDLRNSAGFFTGRTPFFVLDKDCSGGFAHKVVKTSEHFKLVKEL